jgi:DNA-binding MarR family transcriptional regulator
MYDRTERGEAHRRQPESPAARLDLRTYVPAFIAFLSYKLSRGASRLYQMHFGVTTIDWRIIALLAEEPAISGQRICRVIGLDRASVSRSLTALHGRRLVRFSPSDDARERLVTLTPDGIDLYGRIARIALERERRLLSCLTADERKTLVGLLERVHANIGAVDEPLDIAAFASRAAERDAS